MRRCAILATALGLGACQAAPARPLPIPPTGECGAERAQDAIGHRRSDSLAAAVRRRSGAAAVRFLAPGEIHTMEFRADRMTLWLGANGRIARVGCG